MPRDKETGQPKGFAFIMYEDQRSTVLAVDNMNGGTVLGRTIRVSGPDSSLTPWTVFRRLSDSLSFVAIIGRSCQGLQTARKEE